MAIWALSCQMLDRLAMRDGSDIVHVTIKDVAKLSGVSPSTVSRVIADSPKISDKTKARVFKAMEELKYQPNVIARSLANRRTYTLGMILPAKEEKIFENPFFIQAMRGLSMCAQEKGYYIMYNYCQSEEDELKTIEHFVNSKWVDGIILTTTRINDKNVEFLFDREHPFVVIGTPQNHREQIIYVDNNNVEAMENVVNHLIEEGHRRIAFAGGEYQFTVNRHRLRGYRQALEAHGIPYDESLVMDDGTTDEKAYKYMNEIMDSTMPDAIVGTDDSIAYGALKAVMDKTGEPIAVAAFNNTTLAVYHHPSMSSVDVKSEELGHKAAELLVSKIENKTLDDNKIIVDTEYVERESTKNYRLN